MRRGQIKCKRGAVLRRETTTIPKQAGRLTPERGEGWRKGREHWFVREWASEEKNGVGERQQSMAVGGSWRREVVEHKQAGA